MARKMIWGSLLIIAGILVCAVGIKYSLGFDKSSVILPASSLSLFLVATGVAVFKRAEYEGVTMDWSYLRVDVPYAINFLKTGKSLVCINVSKRRVDYRILTLASVIPAGSTHLKVIERTNSSLGVAFLSVRPEEISVTGGCDL